MNRRSFDWRRVRWRSWAALIHDGVDATTRLVGEGHASTARNVRRVTDAVPLIAGPARLIDELRRVSTEGVLGSVRVVNRSVELLLDAGLAQVPVVEGGPVSLRSDAVGGPEWAEDAALGLINGVMGDRLGGGSGSLDLGMKLRHGDHYLPEKPASRADRPRVVVLIHGLATTEWSWCLDSGAYHGDAAATFGSLLASDLGLQPVYVRYNTGRSIADNGRMLAERLEALTLAWEPETLLLLGHSMGGLVARSATHSAARAGQQWLGRVTQLVSLASPHRGSPVAQWADQLAMLLGSVDLPATRIIGQILDVRSAGIQDLREGEVGEEPGDVALLPHISYSFLSATATVDPRLGGLTGDLLVTVESASGPRAGCGPVLTYTFRGVLHHQIQCHPQVYAAVRMVLAAGGAAVAE